MVGRPAGREAGPPRKPVGVPQGPRSRRGRVRRPSPNPADRRTASRRLRRKSPGPGLPAGVPRRAAPASSGGGSVPSVTRPQHPLSVPQSQPGLRPHLRYARRFRDATRRVPAAARSASRVIRPRSSGPAPSRQFRRLRAAGLGPQWPPVPSAPPCPAARRDPQAAPPPCPLPPLPAQPLPWPRGPALRARSTHFSSVMRLIVPVSAGVFWAWPPRAELPRVRPVLALP